MPSLVRLQWRRFALYLGIKNMDSVSVLARTYCLIHPKPPCSTHLILLSVLRRKGEGKQREESVNLWESAVKQRRTRRQCAKNSLEADPVLHGDGESKASYGERTVVSKLGSHANARIEGHTGMGLFCLAFFACEYGTAACVNE